MEKQKTLTREVSLTGIGLHTGNKTTITFKPADPNTHYVFVRTDLEEAVAIPALIDNVVDVSRGTTLGIGDVKVCTVEHVLAALVGLGIDNCIIELTNNEPPVFDGSAINYVNVLLEAGIVEQEAEKEYFELAEQVAYKDKENQVDIVALPLNDYRLTVMIDYFNVALGSQHTGLFTMNEFVEEFASARTFCFLSEVLTLRRNGLIRGGNLDRAVVISDRDVTDAELNEIKDAFNLDETPFVGSKGILNDVALRYPNEPARHKLLDMMGDLALVGIPIKAQILAARPGHKSNIEFAKLLRKQYLQQKKKDRINPKKNKELILDINDILKVMPHRFPMLLVDRIIYMDKEENIIVGVKNVTINEPFFPGHFPMQPVMPGVLICEAMGQVGGLLLWNSKDVENKLMFFSGFDNVRFKKPVVPGDQLVMEVKLVSRKFGIITFQGSCFVDGEVVCSGELKVAIVNKV